MAAEEDKPQESEEKEEEKEDLKPVEKEKKKKEKKPKKPKSYKRYDEPRKLMISAVGGGFLAVLSIVFLTYIFWHLTGESLIHMSEMLDNLSKGNTINAVLGIWALSFTPFTSLGVLAPNWVNDWYFFIIPVIVSGLIIALSTKKIAYTLVTGFFFIFWAIVMPLIFFFIFPLFGLCDPVIVDAVLAAILEDAIASWTPVHLWLNSILNSVFLTWCISGAIEIGLLSMLMSLPFALLFHFIKSARS